jgi:hypothetical protein
METFFSNTLQHANEVFLDHNPQFGMQKQYRHAQIYYLIGAFARFFKSQSNYECMHAQVERQNQSSNISNTYIINDLEPVILLSYILLNKHSKIGLLIFTC